MKQLFRRFLPGVVILSLLLALFPLSLAGATDGVVVSIQGPAQDPVQGNNITVNVTISNVTNLDSCQFEVTYNTNILEVIGAEGGGEGVTDGVVDSTNITVDMWSFDPLGTPGKLFILENVPGLAGVNGSGYLCQIHFHVIGSFCHTSNLTFSGGHLWDNALPPNEITVAAWVDGSVHVAGLPPTDAWVDDDWFNQTDVDIYNAAHGTNLTWQYDAFNVIQDAINAVSNSTVHVLQGEYDGFAIEERNNLNIIGEEAGAVVKDAIDYPDWGCSIIALVANSTAINIDGLEFDGSWIERTVVLGICYYNSTGSITEVTVSDVLGAEIGVGIYIWGGEIDTVDISHTTVEGCQVGVMVAEDQANLDNCTIIGLAGANVFSCGVMAMYGAVVNIESSDISDFWAEEPDPEMEIAGFGIIAGTPIVGAPAEALGEQFGIPANEVTSTVELSDCSKVFDNNFGVYVYAQGDLVANGNNIEGNDIYGVYNEATQEVDAENNWWGDASGPSGVGPGTGDAVSDNVDYDPWLQAPCQKPVTELTADFSASPRTGLGPLRVEFTDETTGGVKPYSYEWDFGDGTRSTTKNPIHIYAAVGGYTVTLAVTDDVGDTDSETKDHYIVVVTEEPAAGAPSFSISNLLISPEQAQPNQQVEISVNIANIGGATGTYTAALYINGQLENSDTVSVGAGSTREVMFDVTRGEAGTYNVSFAGLQGQFAVVATPLFGTGLGTGGIIAIIVIVIALIAALVFLVPNLRKRT
jgi:PKD repeat protein